MFPLILKEPDDRTLQMEAGETILAVSLREGIPHVHACGGYGRCSTCRVLLLEGVEHCDPPTAMEEAMAERLHFGPDIRLACQTAARGGITIRRLVLDETDVELTDQRHAHHDTGAVGREVTIAILFADIIGFTPLAEALPPYDVIHVLNRYFHHMGGVIGRHGGYIDTYVGDGLMALFGVDDDRNMPLRAIRAALDMQAGLGEFNAALRHWIPRGIDIRIGLHYGPVVVGNIGEGSREHVTAIGDAVNLASRIEAANKEIGTRLLISDDLRREAGDRIIAGPSHTVALPGKAGTHLLHEVKRIRASAMEE